MRAAGVSGGADALTRFRQEAMSEEEAAMLGSLPRKVRHWRQRRAEKSAEKIAEDLQKQRQSDGAKTGTYWGV